MGGLSRVADRARVEARLAAGRLTSKGLAADRDIVQWGVVGTGPMAERFSRAIALSAGSNVRSVCSRTRANAATFAKRHGAVAHYEGLSAFSTAEIGKVDIAYIATPVEVHYGQAKSCLEAGLSVLCEKPLCETLVQTEDLYRIAHERGVILMEGMWSWCLPTYKQAAKWLSDGRIGELESIEATLCKAEPHPDKSVMNDYGTYALAFAVRFAGPDLSISQCARRNYAGTCVDCAWEVGMKSLKGVNSLIVIDATSAGDNRAVLRGSCGAISFNPQFNRTNEVSLLDASGKVVERKAYRYLCEGYECQIADAEALVRGRSSETGFHEELSIATARIREDLLSARGLL